jgi:RNA polymerase sigma-70 factor (ECF subfamily)
MAPLMADRDFTALHAEHRGQILAYLHRLTRDLALAEELTQETFLRASRGLPGFRGASKLTTWLYRIATRVYLDQRRREAARRADPDELPPDLAAPIAVEPPGGAGPRLPDRLFEDSEMGTCIRDFVDCLPPDYRAVIVLHDLEGFTNPEIAEALDSSLDAVKIRLHRARRQLRQMLSENCDVEVDPGGALQCDRKQPPDPGASDA